MLANSLILTGGQVSICTDCCVVAGSLAINTKKNKNYTSSESSQTMRYHI